MTDSFIPVGGTDKNLETAEFTNTGGTVVHREGVFIGDGGEFGNKAKVDNAGALKTSLSSQSGVSAVTGLFSETIVGFKVNDVSVDFQYDDLNVQFDCEAPILTGDGAATVVDSVLTVSSASSGTAKVKSRNTIRYVPGHTGFADFTFTVTGVSGKAQCGAYDEEDGFFVEYDITATQWRFGYRRDGVDTVQDFDSPLMQPGSLRLFRILFGYLGSANPVLFTKSGDWVKVAEIVTEDNNAGRTHVLRPVFPMAIYAENGASAGVASWNGGTIGDTLADTGGRTYLFPYAPLVDGTAAEPGTMTLSGTDVGTVSILRLKDTFNGKTNKVKARLLTWKVSLVGPISGSGDVMCQIIALPTLSGTPTYADIDTANSTVEIDSTAGTGASVSYVSGGRVVLAANLSYDAGGRNQPDISSFAEEEADRLGLVGYPGNIFCVVAKDRGGNDVTVRSEFSWKELF